MNERAHFQPLLYNHVDLSNQAFVLQAQQQQLMLLQMQQLQQQQTLN